jgi:hypothetical protein
MYFIDSKNEFNDYLLDPKRKINRTHLQTVCKLYQKEKTCRYISLSIIGYVCMKNSPAQEYLNNLVETKKMSAMADNCEGLGGGI